MTPHKYGLHPEPRGRFRTYALPAGAKVADVPDVDLRPEMLAAGITHKDQGDFGSCVFCSGTVAYAYLSHREHPDRPAPVFSAFYPYYEVRRQYLAAGEIPSISYDSGATASDFIAMAKKKGLCFEKTWPSDADHFDVLPSNAAAAEALDHQALEACALPRISAPLMRAALAADRLPIQIGIAVPPELESAAVAKSGHLDDIADYSLRNILGYHEILVVGSQTIDGHGYFWCWNSWGEDWGCAGDFRVPASLLCKLTIDARITRKME